MQTAQIQLCRYAAAISEPEDVLELRAFPKSPPNSDWIKASDLSQKADDLERLNRSGVNIYIGVNARKGRGVRGDDGVLLARCVFADFDGITVGEACERVARAGLPEPTLLIESGHGVHAYWRLTKPMEDLAEWTAMQKHLARVLQSDPVIHNPERIMRLPGFLNVKGEPVPCEIVECDPLRRYSLEQIRSVIGGVDIEPGRHTPAPPVPESIVEGSRNATLASIAGTMQRRGLSEQAIIAALKEENKTKCQPPLPDSEVEAIARSIARYDPAPTIEPLTDIGNANRFVKSHGANTRFCHKRGAWLCWTGTRWEWDEGERTLTLAKQTALNIFDEAKNAN